MTWVIGGNTPFGYGFIVSDTCVTIGGSRTVDAVQKVYEVGDFIAAGFAGSVRIGFDLIHDLRAFLRKEEGEDDQCWIPDWVAREWQSRAQRVYQAAPNAERECGAAVLMVGAHPTEDGLNGARPYIAVLQSPDFEPTTWNNFDAVQSIGSGSVVDEYKALLRSSFEEEANLMGEMMGPGGMAQVMVGGFMRRIFRNPSKGVGHHLQLFIVRRGGITAQNYEPVLYEGDKETKFAMPRLARGWQELTTLLDEADTEFEGEVVLTC